MNNNLSVDAIRNIDLVSFLQQQGMTPVQTKRNAKFGTTLVYFSPFRNEQHPSFEVFPDVHPQKWIDRAEMDRTGNILNFVARMKNIPDTTANLPQIIQATADAYNGMILDIPQRDFTPKVNEEKQSIVINKVNSIWYNSLIDYLNRRCISTNTARLFCKQVHYSQLKDDGSPMKERVDIGFPNSHNGNSIDNPKTDGGWELRMESEPKTMPDGNIYQYKSKICNAKEPSYILGEGNTRQINIFEGFFDMLSCAEQKMRLGKNPLDEDYIVMNSVALADKVIKKLESLDLEKRTIKLFLDNDKAGNIATDKLLSAIQEKAQSIQDCRTCFEGKKDLNEWHIDYTKRQIAQKELAFENGHFHKVAQQSTKQPIQQHTVRQNKGISI